jgi:hypothetical protein
MSEFIFEGLSSSADAGYYFGIIVAQHLALLV